MKALWDAPVAKYDAADVGNELYLMESFHDYIMVNNYFLVGILTSLSVVYP